MNVGSGNTEDMNFGSGKLMGVHKGGGGRGIREGKGVKSISWLTVS